MCRIHVNRTSSEVQAHLSAADAARPWTPPAGTLGTLVASATERALAAVSRLPDLRAQARDLPPPPAFASALRRETLAIIAVPMFTGTWDCDSGSGDIAMRWNTGFSDKLRLSEDGNRLRGTNDQNGSTVSAVRAR